MANSRPRLYCASACDQCFRSKIRCDSGTPHCYQCERKKQPCTYSSRKKPNKPRKSRARSAVTSDVDDEELYRPSTSINIVSGAASPGEQFQWQANLLKNCRSDPRLEASFYGSPISTPLLQSENAKVFENSQIDPDLPSSELDIHFLMSSSFDSTNSVSSPQDVSHPLSTASSIVLPPSDRQMDTTRTTIETPQGNFGYSSPVDAGFGQIILKLYQQDFSGQQSVGTMLARARQSQVLVTKELEKRDTDEILKSPIFLLACVHIMHSTLACYLRVRSQLRQRGNDVFDSVRVGDFQCNLPQLCQSVYEAIIDQELKIAMKISTSLELWLDDLESKNCTDCEILRPFVQVLQEDMKKATAISGYKESQTSE